MQHDMHLHPTARSRPRFPYVVVIQADLTDGDERLVAPMMVEIGPVGLHKGSPLIAAGEQTFRLLVSQMYPLHKRYLRRPVASLASYRDEILHALDWLFTGI